MPVNRQNTISKARRYGVFAALLTAFVLAVMTGLAYAQGGTTRYVYDDNGRLHAVISPNGEANIYEYDAAGNITAIRRNTANTLEVLDFYPREGVPGTQVTIIGTGFGTGVNTVAFNGTAAQVVSVNAPLVVATVTNGATTGPISVTTASGTATTAQPFTVRGISVTPATADVLSRLIVQFTANVVVQGDQNVVWSVDGVESGSSTVGTISNAGLYVSPNLPANQAAAVFRVRATSVNDAAVFGEAIVTVRNPEFTRLYYSSIVSVLNGDPARLVSRPVSVLNGAPAKLISSPVSVLNGAPSIVFSSLVSILNGAPMNLFSPLVAVTTGPGVTAVSPNQIVRGATATVTITGVGLTGATSLTFLDATDGSVITSITASGILVNGAGTTLTANLTVTGSAVLGRRIIAINTPVGTTATLDTGTNTIEVIP